MVIPITTKNSDIIQICRREDLHIGKNGVDHLPEHCRDSDQAERHGCEFIFSD